MLRQVLLAATLVLAPLPLLGRDHEWTARGPPKDKNGELQAPPPHTPMFSRYTPYLNEESIPAPVYGQPMLRYRGNAPPPGDGGDAPAEVGRRSIESSAEHRPNGAPRREGKGEKDVSAPTSAEERSVERLAGQGPEPPLKTPATETRKEAPQTEFRDGGSEGVSTPVYVDLGRWAASQRPFSRRLEDRNDQAGQPQDQTLVTNSVPSPPSQFGGESLQLTTRVPNNTRGVQQNVAINGTSQLHLPLSRPDLNFPLGPNVPADWAAGTREPLRPSPLKPRGNSTSGPSPPSSVNRTRLVEHRLIDRNGPSNASDSRAPTPGRSPLGGPFPDRAASDNPANQPHRPTNGGPDRSDDRPPPDHDRRGHFQSGRSEEESGDRRGTPPNLGAPRRPSGPPSSPINRNGPSRIDGPHGRSGERGVNRGGPPPRNRHDSSASGERQGDSPNRGGPGPGGSFNHRGPTPPNRNGPSRIDSSRGSGERGRPKPFDRGDRDGPTPVHRNGPPRIDSSRGSAERSRPTSFNRGDRRPFNRGGPPPNGRIDRPKQRQSHSRSVEEGSAERHRGGENGRPRGKGPTNFRPPTGFHDLGQLFPQFPNFPPFPVGEPPPNHERHGHNERGHSGEERGPPIHHHSHERGG